MACRLNGKEERIAKEIEKREQECLHTLPVSHLALTGPQFIQCTPCRLKREEQRIAKEIEEREQEEARKLLEQAQSKKGVKKINIADGAPLDKATLMNQVHASPGCSPACNGSLQGPNDRASGSPPADQCRLT